MRFEKIFRRISGFENIILDTILFESKYPVMFTCKNNNDVYLFICCFVNEEEAKWIGTKTDYDTLIDLLENKITIRNAFLSIEEKKMIIEYNGQNVNWHIVDKKDIDKNLLPTDGEYMDAEDDEYADELAVFKLRNTNMEFIIQPQIKMLLNFKYTGRNITLTDEYFNMYVGFSDTVDYSIGKIQALA